MVHESVHLFLLFDVLDLLETDNFFFAHALDGYKVSRCLNRRGIISKTMQSTGSCIENAGVFSRREKGVF